jgi:hypothetical protein
MRINELIVENQQMDELSLAGALGSAAKGAANIVGKAKGAWAGAKDVYNQQSGRVANVAQRNVQRAGGYKKPAASTATPASLPQTGQGAGASANPASLRQQAAALNQQADQLEKAAAQPAPAAPTSTAATSAAPAPTTTAAPTQWPAGVPKFNSVTGEKFASPEEAEQVTNSPEFKQQMADIAAGKEPGDAQATPQQSPPTPPAATAPAPAPTPTAAPAPTPAAATTPPAGGKMTQAQQDAMKAKLQGQRAAGKTTASQTGAGFKNYVGGSGERMTGVDASGAPIYQKIQRESVDFRSNFLGMMI